MSCLLAALRIRVCQSNSVRVGHPGLALHATHSLRESLTKSSGSLTEVGISGPSILFFGDGDEVQRTWTLVMLEEEKSAGSAVSLLCNCSTLL
jgi:hypothetical protein